MIEKTTGLVDKKMDENIVKLLSGTTIFFLPCYASKKHCNKYNKM